MGTYVWPAPGHSAITSPFGYRICPFHGREMHTGIDIGISYSSVVATRAGTVASAGWSGGYGKCIVINHGGGIRSRYAHLSSFNVKAGDKVEAGQRIATSGSTGNSTGPHLHFEIIVNGAVRNPLSYVKSSDTKSNFTGSKGVSSLSGGSSGSSRSSGSSGSPAAQASKEITSVSVKATTGSTGDQDNSLINKNGIVNHGAEILIQNGGTVFQPEIEGDITLEYERAGAPGKLTFNVWKDSTLKIAKGNSVRFRFNGKNMFFGYVFTYARKDENLVTLTCYDQLRYLKNKDVRSYKKKTYSQLLKQIAKEYQLECGTIENTKYVIPKRIEEGTLFDILGNASDLTVSHTKKLYVLYDDFGKLTLKNIENMKLPILIDADTAESLDYDSSIDTDVYNRIKLYSDNGKTGTREVYVYNSTAKQKKWGILQYTEKADDMTLKEMKEKAKILADYYGVERRTLTVSKAFGDTRVRGGSSIIVNFKLGDKNISNYMVVEKVKHTFNHDAHTMNLDLSGIKGEFNV